MEVVVVFWLQLSWRVKGMVGSQSEDGSVVFRFNFLGLSE